MMQTRWSKSVADHDDTHAREAGSAALRSLVVMEFVANSDRSVSLTEIMQAVKLPKPTVFRILSTLEEAGMLLREPDAKRYVPGERLSNLAANVLLHRRIDRRVAPFLKSSLKSSAKPAI
ncbi:MAG: helix-turn-helix domain-containing protein [Leptolyngbyaceae cyanobacterium CSU_1_4]|nr:helix-turn-helix domain-containing protein [Leptolyngbyaceae cyanobacterium CSU_1_4]